MTAIDDREGLAGLVARATKGPWRFRKSRLGDGDIGILADPGACVAECFSSIRKSFEHATEEQEANAELVSLAPALATQRLTDMVELDRLRATLAQAVASNGAMMKRLEEARALAEAVQKLGLRELVAGWDGEESDTPFEPHPANLGVVLKTKTGTVYAIDAATTAFLTPTQEPTR